jgi:hypothetical protein
MAVFDNFKNHALAILIQTALTATGDCRARCK